MMIYSLKISRSQDLKITYGVNAHRVCVEQTSESQRCRTPQNARLVEASVRSLLTLYWVSFDTVLGHVHSRDRLRIFVYKVIGCSREHTAGRKDLMLWSLIV